MRAHEIFENDTAAALQQARQKKTDAYRKLQNARSDAAASKATASRKAANAQVSYAAQVQKADVSVRAAATKPPGPGG